MQNEVKTLLGTASETGSENQLSPDEIRDWLAEYLSSHDDETKRFPEIATEPHFDLLMADYDATKNAIFVVAVFSGNDITLAAGNGPPLDVRKFAESDFPDDVLNTIPEMRNRFEIGQILNVSKSDLYRWLQTA